ncbi:TPA: hypothetical protein EYP66_14470 [Candidatus Poribacteria bacterium]|nr:hypothetical protein [Candidatus Poribacteria bacterium]
MRHTVLLGILWIGLVFYAVSIPNAETLFEDDFSAGTTKWEIFAGNGSVDLKESNPPKYGPKVLSIRSVDKNAVAFIKDFSFTDGIIEVLWKDAELPAEDADGPLFARVQAPEHANGYFGELDTDPGLHIGMLQKGIEKVLAKGSKLISTADWAWMKFQLDGNQLKIKSWLAFDNEPAQWMVELKDDKYQSGKVGIRVHSGTALIAFLRVTDLQGPGFHLVPNAFLTMSWGLIKQSTIK